MSNQPRLVDYGIEHYLSHHIQNVNDACIYNLIDYRLAIPFR